MLLRILDCYKNRDGKEREKKKKRKMESCTHTLTILCPIHYSLPYFTRHWPFSALTERKEEAEGKYSAFMKENFLFAHQGGGGVG
jgi:hypothetical protein